MISINPIGTANLALIQQYVNEIITFWKGAKANGKVSLAQANVVFLHAIDYLIQKIEPIVIPGEDKKATVMDALSKIYDATIGSVMPFWMLPFNSIIKSLLLQMASALIDYIVAKYQAGSWTQPTPTTFR